MIPFSHAYVRNILLFAICCAFLFFHFHTIELEDYWSDEIGAYEVAKLPTASAAWDRLKYLDTHPPLYFWSLHYFLRFAEPRDINLRWLSVFWALAGMVGFYLWMQWSFGKGVSFLSSLLLAMNPFWLAYCQELRMYTMYPAFLWWGAGVLVLAIRTRKRFWWLLSALLNALALWTHYHAAFFIAAEVVALLVFAFHTRQKSLRSPIMLFICLVVVFSLPLVGLITSLVICSIQRTSWLHSPKWYGLFTCFFEAYFIFVAVTVAKGGQQLLRYSLPFLLLLVFWVSFLRLRRRKPSIDVNSFQVSSFPLGLLVITGFLPVCLMFFLSFSPVKLFLPWRYTILSLAPFLGLLAILLLKIGLPFLRYAFIFYLLCLSGFSNWLLVDHRLKPDWETLSAIIDKNVKDQEILVFPAQHWGNAYLYYSSRKHHFTRFSDLILQFPHKPTNFCHLIYNQSVSGDPFFPWLTVQFMNQLWRHSVLFSDSWYTFIKYEDVDLALLNRWYLQKGIWDRGKILNLNPVALMSAGEIASTKHSKHFGALQIHENQEVYCWVHSPPVPIRLRGEFSEGDYCIILKAGIGFSPKSPPYSLSMNIDGRGVGKWTFERKDVVELVAQFHQVQATKEIELTIDGDWCRPAEFDPTSPDERKLLIHFYWLAVTRDKPFGLVPVED